jgi:hypothetical protein
MSLELNKTYAAHNYHPLRVLLSADDGAWVTDVRHAARRGRRLESVARHCMRLSTLGRPDLAPIRMPHSPAQRGERR